MTCSRVSDSKSMATSVMDRGSASSDAGVQPAEPEASEEDEEAREKIVVEWRFRERVKGAEVLFLTKGRIERGTLTSGDEVMRAFKSRWNVTRPEGVINGTGGEGMSLSSGLREVMGVSSGRTASRVLYSMLLAKAMMWWPVHRMRKSEEAPRQVAPFVCQSGG